VSEDVRWLTYDEVASELAITRESARQLAIRKRWARQKGNDGKARIGVPEDEFQARTSDATSGGPSHGTSDDTGHDPSVIQVLSRHISRLETEIEALKQERETERGRLQGEIEALKQERDLERIRAAQVDALNAVIEAERKRVEDLRMDRDGLRGDRDRWALQAERLAATEIRRWWPFRRRA
jgi:hypothetical protein